MFFDVHKSYLCNSSSDAQMNLMQTLSITSQRDMMRVDVVNYCNAVKIMIEFNYLF